MAFLKPSPGSVPDTAALQARLASFGSAAVAFSGGVDSAFLLSVAHDALGSRVLAVTVRTATFPEREKAETVAFCRAAGIRHAVVDFDVFAVPGFSENPDDRCYRCKCGFLDVVCRVAAEHGCAVVLEGSNADDEAADRPGFRAVRERGVLSPLREAGFGKEQIRAAARARGLNCWDKPSYACLATRFPFGEKLTREQITRVAAAEEALAARGFRQVRVRAHGDLTRIAVAEEEMEKLFAARAEIAAALLPCGFSFVTLDLRGYRSGDMNATRMNTESEEGRQDGTFL